MGTEQPRAYKNVPVKDLLVPPGFASLTSFTLKRRGNWDNSSDAASTPSTREREISCRSKPWILHDQSDCISEESDSEVDENFSPGPRLPKGVIRGCPSCPNCLKVKARCHHEDNSYKPMLEDSPVFYPTEEEFKDTLTYLTSIRPEAEQYGICRIVPPASWDPPLLFKDKNVWETTKFCAHVQRINDLKEFYAKKKLHEVNQTGNKRMKTVVMNAENGSPDRLTPDFDEDGYTESLGFESGPEFTLDTFKRYANDFKSQYFRETTDMKDRNIGLTAIQQQQEPSIASIEGEYWRIIDNPSEEIEVLCCSSMESRVLGSGFPVKSKALEFVQYPEYGESCWNLNIIPKTHGSLLSYESSDTSVAALPRLFIGMCFSSLCWRVEDHHLYALSYVHMGAPKILYSIPGRYSFKFEEFVKRYFPQLSKHPGILHKIASQLSPSMLMSAGIPVYRCVQHPRDFILIYPGAYHSEFSCGFSCSEMVNFAPFDWLPCGQQIVELYSLLGRKTSLSYDKLLFGAAMEAVSRQWESLVRSNDCLNNPQWKNVSGMEGILTKVLKSRIKWECTRRKYLSNLSQSQKMEDDFDATTKRECCICLCDLHLSAVGCSCCANRYACLCHAKQLCSCGWRSRYFLFRYDVCELHDLIEAVEGKPRAIHKWAREKLKLTTSCFSEDDVQLEQPTPGGTCHSAGPMDQRTPGFVNLQVFSSTSQSSVPEEHTDGKEPLETSSLVEHVNKEKTKASVIGAGGGGALNRNVICSRKSGNRMNHGFQLKKDVSVALNGHDRPHDIGKVGFSPSNPDLQVTKKHCDPNPVKVGPKRKAGVKSAPCQTDVIILSEDEDE